MRMKWLVTTTATVVALSGVMGYTSGDSSCVIDEGEWKARMVNAQEYCMLMGDKKSWWIFNCNYKDMILPTMTYDPFTKMLSVQGEAMRCEQKASDLHSDCDDNSQGTICQLSFKYPVDVIPSTRSLKAIDAGHGRVVCDGEVVNLQGALSGGHMTSLLILSETKGIGANSIGYAENKDTTLNLLFNTICIRDKPVNLPRLRVRRQFGGDLVDFDNFDEFEEKESNLHDFGSMQGFDDFSDFDSSDTSSNDYEKDDYFSEGDFDEVGGGGDSGVSSGASTKPTTTAKTNAIPLPTGLTGSIFIDKNSNKKQDLEENNLPETVDVQLLDIGGSVVDTVPVASNGKYIFKNILQGKYVVKIVFKDKTIKRKWTVDPNGALDGSGTVTVPARITRTTPIPNLKFGYQVVDPCLSGNNGGCSKDATCTFNQISSKVTCKCKNGYDGDGTTCTKSSSIKCRHGLECDDNGVCTCPDGLQCGDVNECYEGTHNCHAYAMCRNTPGSFTCQCSYGTTGNGVKCYGSAACAGTVCDEDGSDRAFCTDTARDNEGLVLIPGGLCMCNVGLRLVGNKCLEPATPPCRNNPCAGFKGTTCVNLPGNQFLCKVPGNTCPMWQVGKATIDNTWRTVAFPHTFGEEPVVIAGPPTMRQDRHGQVNIRAVTRTSFEIKFQEPPDCGDSYHGAEIVSWIAVVPDQQVTLMGTNWQLSAGVQIVSTADRTDPQRVLLPVPAAGGAPLLTLSMVQTSTDSDTLATYTYMSGRNVYLDIKSINGQASRRSTIVGWISISGPSSSVNNPVVLSGLVRYSSFVAINCYGVSHLISLGESTATNIRRETNVPLAPWWATFPQTPHLIGGWSSATTRNTAIEDSWQYINFRSSILRSSSVNIKVDAASCYGDRLNTRLNQRSQTWAFSYLAILPDYTTFATRGPAPRRVTPPNGSPH